MPIISTRANASLSMDEEKYSYRFAAELLSSKAYSVHYKQLLAVVHDLPVLIWPGKSATNPKLDVVQQCLNTYFDRRLSQDGWEYHPLATRIAESGLAADFRKDCGGLRVQVEVQFGNMARWYSDIFKFQTAYSQDLADVGVCIVPTTALASRIDSNITNYERVIRELPSAKLSITLPILVIGVMPDAKTPTIDLSKSRFKNVKELTGQKKTENRYRIINGIIVGRSMSSIGPDSETGPIPTGITPDDDSD
jgi:hypothetical protein